MRNLTEVSLKNKNLVWYFIAVIFIAGIFSYMKLGRMEDPAYTIRQMIVSVGWPGADAVQMEQQVTDKIEKKLQDTPGLDYVKSFSRAGEAAIYVTLRDDVDADKIRFTWLEVRNMVNDIKEDLPDGVYGPYYNDRFDDVYGSIYAITGDGYSYEEMRQRAEKIRRILLGIDNVSKVEIIGEQPEKIYIESAKEKLFELGISPQDIANAVQSQQQMTPAGMVETQTDNVYVRFSGQFADVEMLKNMPINAGGRILRLGDIATVERRSVEPAEPKMFYNGQPAVGLAVSMENGGNILKLGENLKDTIDTVEKSMPAGLEIHQVSDQPQVVKNSIDEFVGSLREAVIIVLAVSFLSLGVRTGLVVAGCIPLVIAGVFVGMEITGIDLHKVSLGALIISLGLLVDDAIIAVEMMSVKLEEGLSRFEAACYAYRATAMPMLSGTLITCAGFIPVAFSNGAASEFCRALFPVVGMALILSWFVSVMVAPLYGYKIIKVKIKRDNDGKINPYQSRFYQVFRKILHLCLTHRWKVLAGTVGVFIVSLYCMSFVKQEFFPPSLRPELVVELTLPEGSSLKATEAQAQKLAQVLNEESDKINNFAYYTGQGSSRFVLQFEPVLPKDNYAQFIITAKDVDAREYLREKLAQTLNEQFPEVQSNIKLIEMGPPADYPVMFRVSGYDTDKVKEIAGQVADVMRSDSNIYNVNFDWQEKAKTIHLEFDQDKLRSMGISSQAVAQTLYTEITGATAAQFYTGDRTIDIVMRLKDDDRDKLDEIRNLPIYLGQYGYVPLEQVAKISYRAEDGVIWRRDLKPTIKVQGNIYAGTANDATNKVAAQLKEIENNLPLGYSIHVDGNVENSEKSLKYLSEPLPVMLLVIITILMFQLRSVQLMVITALTAPLGIIGVSFGMLIFDKPIGFVAILGILALSGMIIRNSIILIDQIKKHMADGEKPWEAIIDSAVLRFRPIMLTAAAAMLGMMPLVSSPLWGSMAIAISCGLLVATVLTLLILPTIYAAWFKITPDSENKIVK
ncbi:efflux RND transporter permease subunit [Megamonas hypermegale]|uniref:efflux RND transporter permease subunit n=1 Tax=Megamonas hypermegale TaxID=158847 RepID=UPI0026EC5B2D|nr:efflux RND transporter permease subunit [Megamonas hypermegale]